MSVDPIDVAVVGGGPAGLTAALYAARGLARTVVFEKGMPGGQIVTTDHVENFPGFPDGVSGFDLGELMARQAATHGAEIRAFAEVEAITSVPDGGFTLTVGDETFVARTVVVATGAVPRKLGIPGEAEYTGRGVSWCATCDGAFFRDRKVVVVGGGNAAIEEALFLTKFASKVVVVHRRTGFRAAQVLVERARNHERIEFLLERVPTEIVGEEGSVVGIVLESTVDGSRETLPTDGVFLFVGTDPLSSLLDGLVELDAAGYVRVGPSCTTSVPGLFVAGDVTDVPLKQVVTATGGGAQAGQEALHYLQQNTP